MGTRHLIAVVADGQYKIAQYGQWDGYPSGQGADILEFLHNMDRNKFEIGVRSTRFATEDELQSQWVECGADPDDEWVTTSVSDVHDEKYPENSRDTGANILTLVQNSPSGLAIKGELEFAANSLFCEWAYVVDLDRNTFEVFKGFNKTPLGNGERFYFLQSEEKMKADEQPYLAEYYPVKLEKSFSLSNLPAKATFLALLEEDSEEDDEITGIEPGLSQNK